jgi:hypothetical protein
VLLGQRGAESTAVRPELAGASASVGPDEDRSDDPAVRSAAGRDCLMAADRDSRSAWCAQAASQDARRGQERPRQDALRMVRQAERVLGGQWAARQMAQPVEWVGRAEQWAAAVGRQQQV